MKSKITKRSLTPRKPIPIEIGFENRFRAGEFASRCFSKTTREISVVSDSRVFRLYGKEILRSLKRSGFETSTVLIGQGEFTKNFATLEQICAGFSKASIRRTDGCIALGGGVVGDVAALAASLYLRGISVLHIPTTLVAQIDSSIGGKTAINTEFAKNQIGSFHQPSGILADVSVLRSLAHRDVRSGFFEMLKHGAIGDRKLFFRLKKFLEDFPCKTFRAHFASEVFQTSLEYLIRANVLFKASIVSSDPLEERERSDVKSRKILNFGHTVGHALEKSTSYSQFRHGEAVGIGMLVAAEISKNLGILALPELELLNDVVGQLGSLPSTKQIESRQILTALKSDKKNYGNSLQWILLEKIGQPRIVSSREIPEALIRKAISKVIGGK